MRSPLLRLLAFFAALVSPALAENPRSDPGPEVESYLSHAYPEEISRVQVSASEVLITLIPKASHPQGFFLAEIPMDRTLGDPQRFADRIAIPSPEAGKEITLRTPRFVDRGGFRHDRLLSKWQLVESPQPDDSVQPVSHARYADDIACRTPTLPELKPATKKGLGGWAAGRGPDDDLNTLGISAMTVNVMVNDVISLDPVAGSTPFDWEGRKYYAREDRLAGYDRTFLAAAQRHILVSAILLVPNPAKKDVAADTTIRTMAHADATPEGIFAMPAVTTPDGLALYSAALNLMAERWSRPDGSHGRVHHWIVHNEVDAGWTWTNCGQRDAASFFDLYHRSLRLTHLIARQYDPHARAFISLTHHWAATEDSHYYPSRKLLELLAAFSRVEGNFDWAIAYHPYPQSLFKPRTWEDNEAVSSFNTAKITPKNIEVLDAWVRRPEMAGPDGAPRIIHLSENGFNSADYSEKALINQAAGMAYAWKKIATLDTIQSWQYHNWIDNRHEGGLRIGLRKFPDEPGHELEPKPIWHLYRDLATPAEDKACETYLPVIGITSWKDIVVKFPTQ